MSLRWYALGTRWNGGGHTTFFIILPDIQQTRLLTVLRSNHVYEIVEHMWYGIIRNAEKRVLHATRVINFLASTPCCLLKYPPPSSWRHDLFFCLPCLEDEAKSILTRAESIVFLDKFHSLVLQKLSTTSNWYLKNNAHSISPGSTEYLLHPVLKSSRLPRFQFMR